MKAGARSMTRITLSSAGQRARLVASPAVMDFGIVRIIGGTEHTATGAVVGTALYMAPEQIRGEHPDHRADVYSLGVTLYELVSAYAIFANKGKKVQPVAVRHIINRHDEVIFRNTPLETQVLAPGVAYLITSLLQSVVQHGTATKVKALGRPVAGKTGTTNNFVDAWFMGFIPDIVTGVWVGKDKDEPLGHNETGSRAAIPIWLDYMKAATEGKPIKDFRVLDDVVNVKIDPETGAAADFDFPSAEFEIFLKDNPPEKAKSELDHMTQNSF